MDSNFGHYHRFIEHSDGMSLSVVLLLATAPFLLTWLFTTAASWLALKSAERSAEGLKRPPTLPSYIPILGHTIWFLRDPHSLLTKAA